MKKLLCFYLPVLLLAVACTKEPALSGTESVVPEEARQDPCLVQGVVLVQLSDGMIEALQDAGSPAQTKSAAFNSLSEALSVTSVERVFPDAGRFEARHREAGLHRWYRIRYEGGMPSTKAAGGLEDIDGILSVEIPRRKKERAFSFFNDPYSYYQWDFYNDATLASGFRKGADINVVPVWEKYTTGSSKVIVAVVDSGVDGSHRDLSGVVIPRGARISPSWTRNMRLRPPRTERTWPAPSPPSTTTASACAALPAARTATAASRSSPARFSTAIRRIPTKTWAATSPPRWSGRPTTAPSSPTTAGATSSIPKRMRARRPSRSTTSLRP